MQMCELQNVLLLLNDNKAYLLIKTKSGVI